MPLSSISKLNVQISVSPRLISLYPYISVSVSNYSRGYRLQRVFCCRCLSAFLIIPILTHRWTPPQVNVIWYRGDAKSVDTWLAVWSSVDRGYFSFSIASFLHVRGFEPLVQPQYRVSTIDQHINLVSCSLIRGQPDCFMNISVTAKLISLNQWSDNVSCRPNLPTVEPKRLFLPTFALKSSI